MEQVRSVRARYVKREAREGDDGMGLKYPQKDRVRLGTRQMRMGFRSHVFWWNVTAAFFISVLLWPDENDSSCLLWRF